MSSATRSDWPSALRRLWWLPLLVAVISAVVVGFNSPTTTADSTSAVVNTRSASSLPNERLDLINDLSAVLDVTSVINPVAAQSDMSPGELREALVIKRIESSTLARITLTTSAGDDRFRREVIKRFLAETKDYLGPTSPSPALEAAELAESEAIDDYYEAIEANNGQVPTETFTRLLARLVDAQAANDKRLYEQLLSFLPNMSEKAKEFERIDNRRARATANLRIISQLEIQESGSGPAGLQLTFLDTPAQNDSLTSSEPLRRGLGAGLAAGLVVAGLIVLLARGGRLGTRG